MSQLFLVEIPGQNLTLIFHGQPQRKGLTARSRTDIQHPASGRRLRRQSAELCRRVLDVKVSGAERGKAFQVAAAAHQQAVLQPRVLLHFHTGPAQLIRQCLTGGFQGIELNDRICRGIVQGQQRLHIIPQFLSQQLNQRQRMAVQEGQLLQPRFPLGNRRRSGTLEGPQHGIDHPCSAFVLAVSPHKFHRLMYRGAVRHPVQKVQLIQPHAETQTHRHIKLVRWKI